MTPVQELVNKLEAAVIQKKRITSYEFGILEYYKLHPNEPDCHDLDLIIADLEYQLNQAVEEEATRYKT